MPATVARLHGLALLGYVSVAVLFAWPIPLHLGTALPGSPGGDTGVYVWNLWVFRHEILAHGRFPFFTLEILSVTPPVPLTLHNYTTVANVLALPLLPLAGVVATFNLLMITSVCASAYATFVFLRDRVGDAAGAWLGGLLFGFSPFMAARQMAHFSLVQAAALPVFALLLYRFRVDRPTPVRSVAAGAVVAWAYLSDPYYAIYCVMMAVFLFVWDLFAVEGWKARAPLLLRGLLNTAIACVAGLVAGIVISGGGRFEVFGLRISMTRLYTPVLVLTVLVLARLWCDLRPRLSYRLDRVAAYLPAAGVAAVTCVLLLSPVLSAMGTHWRERQWISPPVWWRSSAPGVDLLAFLVPNPVNPLLGWVARDWLSALPAGFHENVASVPWTATFVVVLAVLYAGCRLPRYWVVFTGLAALLALGPFIQVGGLNTHVPTPWAVLRYVPVLGAARMPTRFTVLVMLGLAVLLACAVKAFRDRSPRAWLPPLLIGGLLVVELMPAPRPVFDAVPPSFHRLIAADPREVRVLHLPFGLRDGLSSAGNFSAYAQFLQTFHEKPIVGGYLSRLRASDVPRFREWRLLRLLMDLSERQDVSAERYERAVEDAHGQAERLGIGYVIMDDARTSGQLVHFVKSALDLAPVATDRGQTLYIVR